MSLLLKAWLLFASGWAAGAIVPAAVRGWVGGHMMGFHFNAGHILGIVLGCLIISKMSK
mgnify:CR=1 FL=1|tara:strand:+ start:34972 stop:35148 length:177 start_codon:yes stop_codon:yes gene_type:complete